MVFERIFLIAAQFHTSRKGKPLLQIGGYTFCKDYVTRSKMRWKCSTHYPKQCKASVYTLDDIILTVNNEHNH